MHVSMFLAEKDEFRKSGIIVHTMAEFGLWTKTDTTLLNKISQWKHKVTIFLYKKYNITYWST